MLINGHGMRSGRVLIVYFCIISLILVFLAPSHYSLSYCIALNILYLVVNVLYFLRNRDDFWGFSGLFAMCFYFMNFIYPVFYYPFPLLRYFFIFSYSFDENVITYATAVSLFAYVLYLAGRTLFNKNAISKVRITTFKPRNYKILVAFFIIVYIVFTAAGGFSYFSSKYFEGNMSSSSVLTYSNILRQALMEMSIIVLFTNKVIYDRWKVLILVFTAIVVALIFMSGNRGNGLFLILLVVFMYNDKVRRIKPGIWILGLIGGIVLFTFIGRFRGSGFQEVDMSEMTATTDSNLDYFSDLIKTLIKNIRIKTRK